MLAGLRVAKKRASCSGVAPSRRSGTVPGGANHRIVTMPVLLLICPTPHHSLLKKST
jgi:hypothetical protein